MIRCGGQVLQDSTYGRVDKERMDMPDEAEWLRCGAVQLWRTLYSVCVSLSRLSIAPRVLQEKCPGNISLGYRMTMYFDRIYTEHHGTIARREHFVSFKIHSIVEGRTFANLSLCPIIMLCTVTKSPVGRTNLLVSMLS
jgi:hypothetical protein